MRLFVPRVPEKDNRKSARPKAEAVKYSIRSGSAVLLLLRIFRKDKVQI